MAQLYDAVRPGYPKALIEDVIRLANLPPEAKILEVGTGIDKATVPFAYLRFSLPRKP